MVQPSISVSILPQTPLPSRLPHNVEQNSLCYAVGLGVLVVGKACPTSLWINCVAKTTETHLPEVL